MRFRVHDGACDALLPGAVGTLAGHPDTPYTCGCGQPDCPHPTPEPAPPPEKPEGGDDAEAPEPEPPPVGLLWLVFAEDQLTEAKRAERGTLPVPEPEPETCATCAGAGVVQMQARRSTDGDHLELDVVATNDADTELVIPHGMALEAAPRFFEPPLHLESGTIDEHGRLVRDTDSGRVAELAAADDDAVLADLAEYHERYADGDDTAEFEVDPEGGSDYAADDYPQPEPLVPELLDVQCPACRGTGIAPPPPPPLIPNNPLPFRAGVRADQAKPAYDRVDGAGSVGYGA